MIRYRKESVSGAFVSSSRPGRSALIRRRRTSSVEMLSSPSCRN